MTPSTLAPKPRYEILDGLRGVAALTVVLFHFFEAHNGNDVFKQIVNHGYLAVDFFFLLSGFVIGYAYDDRWSTMSIGEFFRRRLIRLQPLVVAGTLFGGAMYYFQASAMFPMIETIAPWKLLLAMLAGALMIPLTPSLEIRGWTETYPLNGPAWSLFFEYVANLLYAVFLRRLSVVILSLLVLVSGGVTVHYLLTMRGDMIGGWALDAAQLRVGFTRLAFPFLAGLLLFRLRWLLRVPKGFWLCSLVLVLLLSLPRFGTPAAPWINGVYEAACILLLFPLLVVTGAGSELGEGPAKRICLLLGRLSYPIYILHYPIVYCYFALLSKGHGGPATASALILAILVVAYLALRFYDEPLRARLSRNPRAKGVA